VAYRLSLAEPGVAGAKVPVKLALAEMVRELTVELVGRGLKQLHLPTSGDVNATITGALS